MIINSIKEQNGGEHIWWITVYTIIYDYDDDDDIVIGKSGGEKSAARKGRDRAREESGTNIPTSDSAAAAN